MTAAVLIAVPVTCAACDGRPFVVHVPMRTENVGGWLRVVVDRDQIRAAVRAHARQHLN